MTKTFLGDNLAISHDLLVNLRNLIFILIQNTTDNVLHGTEDWGLTYSNGINDLASLTRNGGKASAYLTY